ncbi:hypothetical protein ACVIHH_003667 [Bradyrhizobium sp. USDA 4518]
MRTATASRIDHKDTSIGRELARRGVDVLLDIEDGNALIRCQVSSAIATAMLAPLGGDALGQFRPLAGNLVEVDAIVTLAVAQKMLAARTEALVGAVCLH